MKILFEFNYLETKNENEKKDEKIEINSEMNVKEKVEEIRKSKSQRTTVIPHTKPIQADSAAIPECSLRKNDFLCYKEHSEILFAFSSVLVKVMQPSAVRTIRLIPFSTCLSNLQNITSEVRIFFVLFVISLYFS